MIQNFNFFGDLKFGKYKSISCAVKLTIDNYEEDEWADPDTIPSSENYIDGVRALGEFYFDSWPITSKHPIKSNAIGELLVYDKNDSSKLNILITDNSGESVIIPKKLKRYHWNFFVIGKPYWDKLNLFPPNYQGVNMNRVYCCTNFRGYWPVEVASVIVAADKKEARILLNQKLKESGISVDDVDFDLTEINLKDKNCVILNSGEWN